MEYFLNKLQDKILIIDYSGKILFCNNILFLICFILYKITGFIDKTLKI